jgi:hypothetical protein
MHSTAKQHHVQCAYMMVQRLPKSSLCRASCPANNFAPHAARHHALHSKAAPHAMRLHDGAAAAQELALPRQLPRQQLCTTCSTASCTPQQSSTTASHASHTYTMVQRLLKISLCKHPMLHYKTDVVRLRTQHVHAPHLHDGAAAAQDLALPRQLLLHITILRCQPP